MLCKAYSIRFYKFIRQRAALLFRILPVLWLTFSSSAERLPIKTYTVADGLLRDLVYRIKQDSRGFLWFCTAEGISRFDGAGMTNFTAADGLPNRVVTDFLETKKGTIYIATHGGLARLNPRGLRSSKENPLFTVFLPDNKRAEKIQTLYEDRNNQVWVGTSDGLYKLIETDGRTTLENVPLGEPLKSSGGAIDAPSPNTLSIYAILETKNGALWIGSYGGGLFRLAPDSTVRRFTADDTAGLGDNKITDLLEDRDGRLWLAKRSDQFGGLCRLDAEATENPVKKCYTTANGLGSNWIRDIYETSDGGLWLATVPGLCRFQPENSASVCKTYSAKNDLCDDVFALAEDKDGNLWTGSTCGAKKITRYGFTTYNAADGLDSDHINSIFENSTGELFAATFPKTERVISRFDGDKFSIVKPRLPDYVDYHGWGWQQTVWQDSRGAWWIPTGWGLFRSPDNTSFENLARAQLEKLDTGATDSEAAAGGAHEVFRLFEDSRGDLWIVITGWSNKLLRWERARNIWHDYTSQVGFSPSRVGSAFVEDRHGNIWIGASSDHHDSALIRYRNGEFQVRDEGGGMRDEFKSTSSFIPHPSSLIPQNAPSGWIRDLFLDSRGRLWIASTGSGVWRLDDTNSDNFEFVKYTPTEGLSSIAAASVTEDEFGRIYIGTWRGIDRLNPDTRHIENFTTADGLPASFVEVSYRDRHNNLWFATDKGLARFVPEPPRNRQPPNILITGLRVEGEPQAVSILGASELPTLELDSSKRQIAVDFLGLGTNLGERLKYEYRFGDADWTETTERTVNFTNLAAGEYLMEVRAQTADRIYSRQPASISFRIAAPFYLRPWFLLAAVLLVGGLAYLLYRRRVARLLEMERMRTRIATDLHDDIGSNLTKISVLSEVAQRKLGNAANGFDGGNLLENIAETSRESVSAMSDIVWAINPKKDSLADLTRRMRRHAEEILERREIRLNFDAPPVAPDLKLDANLRRNIYLIFKESLNNIVRHSQASQVGIDFRFENGAIVLQITDDGRGFDENEEFDGNGLLSMKKRAAELKGSLKINSAENEGTTIVLVLNPAFRRRN